MKLVLLLTLLEAKLLDFPAKYYLYIRIAQVYVDQIGLGCFEFYFNAYNGLIWI